MRREKAAGLLVLLLLLKGLVAFSFSRQNFYANTAFDKFIKINISFEDEINSKKYLFFKVKLKNLSKEFIRTDYSEFVLHYSSGDAVKSISPKYDNELRIIRLLLKKRYSLKFPFLILPMSAHESQERLIAFLKKDSLPEYIEFIYLHNQKTNILKVKLDLKARRFQKYKIDLDKLNCLRMLRALRSLCALYMTEHKIMPVHYNFKLFMPYLKNSIEPHCPCGGKYFFVRSIKFKQPFLAVGCSIHLDPAKIGIENFIKQLNEGF